VIPIILSAVIGLVSAFLVTFVVMPYIIKRMKSKKIVGIDVHKLDKPEVAEMGGVGILVGLVVGCVVLFISFGFIGGGFFDFRILVFMLVILFAGLIGIVDDLKPLGPKIKPILTALACLPILVYSWTVIALGLVPPVIPAYDPGPLLPFLGRTRLTIIYPFLLVPLAIAVPANAINMIDVFNGVMPLTAIFMFVAIFIVSFFMLFIGVPGAEMGVLLSGVMLGVLLAYLFYNRYPAQTFAGDTGSLAVGSALGAIAILGRVELIAIVALLPAVMNAFYSLVSIGGLLERRQMRSRPTIFQDDGTLAASQDKKAPLTLTRLVLARGPLTEPRIILSLTTLTLASSVLAVLTLFLIPFDIGFLLYWPVNLLIAIIPLCLLLGTFLALRNIDHLGLRLAGLISIMIGVWTIGMFGFWLLDFLIVIVQSDFWPIVGILFVFGWLALWYYSTKLYFRYASRRAEPRV
jgi:UDP-N-acetylglucosamine--dolichyl-phosphate N-acetylglucosaminephosphotransferase